MRYEFYLDVFWVTNFVMDFFGLAMAVKIRKKHSPIYRPALAAAFGASGSALLFLVLRRYMLYQLLVLLVLNPVMILITFPIKGLREFVKDSLTVYILLWFLGGVVSFGMQTLGGGEHFLIWALGGMGICMLTLYFFGREKEEDQVFEILLKTEARSICVRGFLDTGNLLMDPTVNRPVHIIQEKLLAPELEKEELPVRYIPYHSLGQEQGLLPVVTLKGMYISQNEGQNSKAPVYIDRPVIGLAKEKLFQSRDYQVILNARYRQI